MRRRRLHYGSLEFSIDGSFRVEQTVEGVWLFGLFENWPNYTPKTFFHHGCHEPQRCHVHGKHHDRNVRDIYVQIVDGNGCQYDTPYCYGCAIWYLTTLAITKRLFIVPLILIFTKEAYEG